MTVRALRLFLFLTLFFLFACGSAAAEKGMQLSIVLDKEEYGKSDPISMNFKLKNTGKEPVYINKRFQIASKDSPKEDREVYLTVISPKGDELPYKASPYKTGLPKSDYFVLLNAGEETTSEHKMNLKGFFELNEAGEYKIIATYQNVYGKEIGLDTFKEEIKSKPITIKIIE